MKEETTSCFITMVSGRKIAISKDEFEQIFKLDSPCMLSQDTYPEFITLVRVNGSICIRRQNIETISNLIEI
jgi:hypothetical protein